MENPSLTLMMTSLNLDGSFLTKDFIPGFTFVSLYPKLPFSRLSTTRSLPTDLSRGSSPAAKDERTGFLASLDSVDDLRYGNTQRCAFDIKLLARKATHRQKRFGSAAGYATKGGTVSLIAHAQRVDGQQEPGLLGCSTIENGSGGGEVDLLS